MNRFLFAWFALAVGCHESTASTAATEGSSGSGESGAETGMDDSTLDIQDIGWLCNTDPPAGEVLPLEDVLFKRKRRLRLIPGTYDVLGGEEVAFEYVFEGVTRPIVRGGLEVTEEPGYWGSAPWGWFIDEADGWRTLKYLQPFDTEPPTMTDESGTRALVLLTSVETDAPSAAYTFSLERGLAAYGALLGPCDPPFPGDFVHVTFEEGELTLETREGWYAGGFLLHATGAVDGIAIDVSVRDDLSMHPADIEESYLGLSVYGVRWPDSPGPEGECGVVLEADLATGDYRGWFVDCSLRPLRDVSVLSVDVEPGS